MAYSSDSTAGARSSRSRPPVSTGPLLRGISTPPWAPLCLVLFLSAGCDGEPAAPADLPRVVEELAPAERAMAVGEYHACLLADTGEAFCWGQNAYGQLGRGDQIPSSTPVPVAGGLAFHGIAAAGNTTCAWTGDGVAYCWGAGRQGALGDGGADNSPVPVPVAGGLAFAEVSVGAMAFACGRTLSGEGYCWGTNDRGQLGTGNRNGSSVPALVQGGLEFAAIGAGFHHACGLTPEGAAHCWGAGELGVLGSGWVDQIAPAPVVGGHTFTRLGVGATTTCGVATAGQTLCWGTDFYGSLGFGSVTPHPTSAPLPIAGDPGFVSAGAANENSIFSVSCGRTAAGAAFCWGPNPWGGLGSSTPTETCQPRRPQDNPFTCTGTPTPVQGGLSFAALFPSNGFTCGVTTNGRAYCWGLNSQGQLGSDAASSTCDFDGPEPCSYHPLPVAGARDLRR